MPFFNMLINLKNNQPNSKETSLTMIKLGFICFGLGILNGLFPIIIPDVIEYDFSIYQYVAIIGSFIICFLCILSAFGIKKEKKWSILIGKLAIGCFFTISILAVLFIYHFLEWLFIMLSFPISLLFFKIGGIFSVIIHAVFSYLGACYLNKLPFKS